MRASFLASLLSSIFVTSVACLSPAIARADEPMRSDDARLVDVKLDVALGVQGYGDNGDVSGGAAVEPALRFHFSFVDADPGARKGLAVHDDAWLDIGGIGARNAGGFALGGAGFSLLPGFRSDWIGLFFGPSARAGAWVGGGKSESHAFTYATLPFEARFELFEGPAARYPRVILTGWYAPWPDRHHLAGGRVEIAPDVDKPFWFYGSFEWMEGIESDKTSSADSWSSTHGPSFDVRIGVTLSFDD